MQTDAQYCEIIRANIDKLADSADFAKSLVANVARHGATDKQRYWLERLAARATGAEPSGRTKTPVGDLKGVMDLFDKARSHLKAPAVVIQIGSDEIRLSIAGERARAPGSINVATNGGYGDSTWFGRILQDGQFEASPREPTPPALIEGLKRFAAEPARMAAEHGKLTGKCCFCNRPLTDERSTHVGYGRTCASNFGLPYPKIADLPRESADLFS